MSTTASNINIFFFNATPTFFHSSFSLIVAVSRFSVDEIVVAFGEKPKTTLEKY